VKIILDLCGGTGAWSKPYVDAGYDVRVITLPEYDVRLYQPGTYIHEPSKDVYGILAAPPCTMFASSGARWKRTNQQMIDALGIVDACLRIIMICEPVFWALENPVGKLHRWLEDPVMRFDPCDYGDPYTKKTCLWGKFNPPIKNPVEPEKKNRIHHMSPGPERSKLRSITPPGFAKAFFEANP
jgi:hypothetical protein